MRSFADLARQLSQSGGGGQVHCWPSVIPEKGAVLKVHSLSPRKITSGFGCSAALSQCLTVRAFSFDIELDCFDRKVSGQAFVKLGLDIIQAEHFTACLALKMRMRMLI